MMGRGGTLGIRVESATTVDNQKLKLRSTTGKEGDDKTGTTVALVVLFGPLGFLKKGKNAVIKPGTEINEIISHEDWLPTLLAAAGQPNVKESALTGLTAGGSTYKVHFDGYNLMPYFKGETKEWPRRDFVYWTDDGDCAALRFEQWKMVFLEQRAESLEVWQDPLVELRFPKLFTLRGDPFERGDRDGIEYKRWRMDRVFMLGPASGYVAQWMQSFKDFPPRSKPGTFNLSHVMAKLSKTPE